VQQGYHYHCAASFSNTQTSKKEPLLLSAMSFTACCANPEARSGLAPLNCILKHSWILSWNFQKLLERYSAILLPSVSSREGGLWF
jgi:hypothetical protein